MEVPNGADTYPISSLGSYVCYLPFNFTSLINSQAFGITFTVISIHMGMKLDLFVTKEVRPKLWLRRKCLFVTPEIMGLLQQDR